MIVEGERAATNLAVLHARLRSCFRRSEPFEQVRKYVAGLASDLPRKNGWTLAEHAGDTRPDRMQRLLNHAVWDHEKALRIVRGFVAEHLADHELRVAALDESGQPKQGSQTAGVMRQYMGCTGQVTNGVNTVYCSYATPCGHALVAAKLYLPRSQLDDPSRRQALGIDETVSFRTKPQLAQDLLAEMITDGTMPEWVAGDEVYGRAGSLRKFLEDNQIGYVMRVGSAFRSELRRGCFWRADDAVARFAAHPRAWQTRTVTGSKGDRAYAWAWIATTSDRHWLLARKHLVTGEIAYHYAHVPDSRPVHFMQLVRVACLRWPVEEDFEFSKDHFGLDHTQARRHTALTRHIVLTLAALAVCAITVADAKTRAPQPILPTGPDDQPPRDTGLIALTVAEIKRLLALANRQPHPDIHHLRWTWWRRQHQARARWHHHRTRLRRHQHKHH